VEATTARSLLDGLRRELEEVERRVREHPFLAAIERGTASEVALRAFAAEQGLIIASDRRSFAQLAARFPEQPAGDFFLSSANGEGRALELLEPFAESVGAPDEYEPLAGCQAYPAFVSWLALNGGRADVALAFLVNLNAWGDACRRIATALRGRYDTSFFEFFAQPPPGFANQALSVAEQGLAAGESPARANTAARLLQTYELLYWDTLGAL
jgi:thiaminase